MSPTPGEPDLPGGREPVRQGGAAPPSGDAPPGALARLLGAADRAVGWLARAFAWAGVAMLLVSTVAVFYSVVMRYVLNRPQTWTDELVGFLTVALVMLGAGEAMRRRDHVGVDLLTARAGPRMRRLADLWASLAVLLVAVVLVVGGWEMVAFSHMVGLISEGYLEAPVWIPQLVVPIGMAVIAVVALVRIARLAAGLDHPDPVDGQRTH